MVFNAKGGVGKTGIAINLSLTYGYSLVTNDKLSIAETVLGDESCLTLEKGQAVPKREDFREDLHIVYDFGGYPDQRALKAAQYASFIIVPVLPQDDIIEASLNFTEELRLHANKDDSRIIIIGNQVKNNYDKIESQFNVFWADIPVFPVKSSSVFAWMLKEGLSIQELADKYPLHRRYFQPVADQFNCIMEYIKKT